MNNYERIIAVVVTYFPEVEKLRSNLLILSELGLRVVLVDNTPYSPYDEYPELTAIRNDPELSSVEIRGSGENIGLSRAYNQVLKQYMDTPGIDGFLFLDQDSILLRKSLLRLFESFYRIRKSGKLGVIGGNPLKSDNEPYGFRAEEKNIYVAGCHATRMVPSSFSIVPIEVFHKVGMFYDDFFIDHIDMDFCYRLRRAGMLVVYDSEAIFSHAVGHGDVILFGKYITPVSAPFRHYFQVRNSILSYKRAGFGLFDLLKEISKRIAMVLLQALVVGALMVRCRYAWRGIVDGLRGVGGGLPPDLGKFAG